MILAYASFSNSGPNSNGVTPGKSNSFTTAVTDLPSALSSLNLSGLFLNCNSLLNACSNVCFITFIPKSSLWYVAKSSFPSW